MAKIIDGKAISKQVREEIAAEVESFKAERGTVPGLAVIISIAVALPDHLTGVVGRIVVHHNHFGRQATDGPTDGVQTLRKVGLHIVVHDNNRQFHAASSIFSSCFNLSAPGRQKNDANKATKAQSPPMLLRVV